MWGPWPVGYTAAVRIILDIVFVLSVQSVREDNTVWGMYVRL